MLLLCSIGWNDGTSALQQKEPQNGWHLTIRYASLAQDRDMDCTSRRMLTSSFLREWRCATRRYWKVFVSKPPSWLGWWKGGTHQHAASPLEPSTGPPDLGRTFSDNRILLNLRILLTRRRDLLRRRRSEKTGGEPKRQRWLIDLTTRIVVHSIAGTSNIPSLRFQNKQVARATLTDCQTRLFAGTSYAPQPHLPRPWTRMPPYCSGTSSDVLVASFLRARPAGRTASSSSSSVRHTIRGLARVRFHSSAGVAK